MADLLVPSLASDAAEEVGSGTVVAELVVLDTSALVSDPEAIFAFAGADAVIPLTVVEELGSDAFAYCTLPGHDATSGTVDVIAKVDPRNPPAAGDRIRLRPHPSELHFFCAETGRRLSDVPSLGLTNN